MELLPVAGIFGPNGAGKSNLLRALASMAKAVRNSHSQWQPDEKPPWDPFLTKTGPLEQPTVYEIVFVLDGALYEYEFSVGARHITHELLTVARGGPRSRTKLFERTADSGGIPRVSVGRKLHGPRAAALGATRPNSLFLSSAAQSNQEALLPVWRWIRHAFWPAEPFNSGARADRTATLLFGNNSAVSEGLRLFLRAADFGIDDVEVRREALPAEDVRRFEQMLAVWGHELPEPGSFDFFETTIKHRGDVGDLPLAQESAGTQAWFSWAAPVLEGLAQAAVISADELDSALSANLVGRMVRLFQDPSTNARGAQLIFCGQNPQTASLSGLARDQLWVVEKDLGGASSLAPATDFGLRRDWDVGQAYSAGRLGGIPVIDDLALRDAVSKM